MYVYGHSLGESDGNVFKEIILNTNVKNIVVYYHTDGANACQIENLTKILGEDKMIELCYDGKMSFKKQAEMIEGGKP